MYPRLQPGDHRPGHLDRRRRLKCIPDDKARIIEERGRTRSRRSSEQYVVEGRDHRGEKYNKVVDIWSWANERSPIDDGRHSDRDGGQSRRATSTSSRTPSTRCSCMADSGARGSPAADPSARRHAGPDGQARTEAIIETPITCELPRGAERSTSTSSPPTAPARVWRTRRSRPPTRGT